MEPTLLSETSLPLVNMILDAIVEALRNDEEYGGYDINFDCALMNLYRWRVGVRVAHRSRNGYGLGSRFGHSVYRQPHLAFKLRETRRWGETKRCRGRADIERMHHGDCILMRDDCNDNWEHCVFGKENDSNNSSS